MPTAPCSSLHGPIPQPTLSPSSPNHGSTLWFLAPPQCLPTLALIARPGHSPSYPVPVALNLPFLAPPLQQCPALLPRPCPSLLLQMRPKTGLGKGRRSPSLGRPDFPQLPRKIPTVGSSPPDLFPLIPHVLPCRLIVGNPCPLQSPGSPDPAPHWCSEPRPLWPGAPPLVTRPRPQPFRPAPA